MTVAEATTLTYNVRKYGRTTRLTGGKLQAIAATISETNETIGARTCTNAIAVRPNARSDGSSVRFSAPGDSGSAYVNDANEIIGVHFTGNPRPGETDTGWGWGTEIKAIIDSFAATDHIALAPATATALGQVQTTTAAALPAPMVATGDAAALAARLEAELSMSELGRSAPRGSPSIPSQ